LGRRIAEAPLAELVTPGDTVLLKPNWVLHYNKSGQGKDCLITPPRFVLATLAQLVRGHPGRVIIADAPVQGCDFEQIVEPWFVEKAQALCGDIPVEFKDLRRTVVAGEDFERGVQQGLHDNDDYVLFDLGHDSLLEQHSGALPRFRVTQYDPRKLAHSHRPGKHQYLIAKAALTADVFINLPKLKTHLKAGITGALKNQVGINGNKDFLPHHRLGGSAIGGDNYPGFAPLKLGAELAWDLANMHIGMRRYWHWRRVARGLLQLNHRFGDRDSNLEGGWHGNDTVWRMVIDLNRILLYGDATGHMHDTRQRRVWHLTDAVVIGQGDGPLAPRPGYVGAVTFSDCAVAAEEVHAALLRLDPTRIPLVREASARFRWPLCDASIDATVYHDDTEVLSLDRVARELGIDATPAAGWRNTIEAPPWRQVRSQPPHRSVEP
jgi:uncharacterized protein (DUF362 family)